MRCWQEGTNSSVYAQVLVSYYMVFFAVYYPPIVLCMGCILYIHKRMIHCFKILISSWLWRQFCSIFVAFCITLSLTWICLIFHRLLQSCNNCSPYGQPWIQSYLNWLNNWFYCSQIKVGKQDGNMKMRAICNLTGDNTICKICK